MAEPTIQPPPDCIEPPMSINDVLPTEILLAILTSPEIDPTHIVLGRVCSRWRSVLSMAPPLRDDDIWSLLDCHAAAHGFIGLFEWMDTIGRPRTSLACPVAAFGGRVATLAWLVDHGWPVDMLVYSAAAARKGHAHVLSWLLSRSDALAMDGTVLDDAVHAGCAIDHLEWLVRVGAPWPTRDARYPMHTAGQSGKIEVIEWVARAGPQPTAWIDAICGAAEADNVGLLDALYAAGHFHGAQGHRNPLGGAFFWASKSQSLAAMAWLADHDPSLTLDDDAIRERAQTGKLSSVKWIVERNQKADPTWKPHADVAMDAVRAGHLAIVRYLCEPPADGGGAPLCVPTATIYFEAAGAGHWHVVEWAAATGVPWDMSSVVVALHRLSQRTVAQRAGYVRLVDDGIWHCSPALRELVASWPCADDTGGAVPINQSVPQEHAMRRLHSAFSGFLGCDNAPPTPGDVDTVDMFVGLVGRALASGR